MKIGIYPGSFDPLTEGHMGIITRVLGLCDTLIVAVAVNPAKTPFFSAAERVAMITEACRELKNIEVTSFEGLLSDFCVRKNVQVVFRGLRSSSDFDYERSMALMNRRLAPGTETVFMVADGEHHFVSSSMVREIASLGGDYSSCVPAAVRPFIRNRLAQAR